MGQLGRMTGRKVPTEPEPKEEQWEREKRRNGPLNDTLPKHLHVASTPPAGRGKCPDRGNAYSRPRL